MLLVEQRVEVVQQHRQRNAVIFADRADRVRFADRAVRAAAEMEAREDPPCAGMQFERLVDGHLGGKMLLIHRLVLFRYNACAAPAGCTRPLAASAEYACKPDSVPTAWADDHLSGARVTARLDAT